jgi:mono/diheme cytochrome c family protein
MPGRPFPLRQVLLTAACIAAGTACRPSPAPAPFPEVEPEAESRPAMNQADTVSEQDVLTEGRKIFHGQGLCYACHGGRLQGGPVAPPLAGPDRNVKDTSFAYILRIVRAGEPHSPMVANQGGIDAGQIVQVANYVWAVSNGKSVP